MAVHRALPCRARRRRRRRPRRPARLLLRVGRRRRMEVHRRRHLLAERLRRLPEHRLRRRNRRRPVGPQRRVRGHGRDLHPHRPHPRRRRLPLRRRRRHLEAPRPGGHPPHLPRPRPSRRPRPRIRGRIWTRLRSKLPARHLQVEGRRELVAKRPPQERGRRRGRPVDGPQQPARALRLHVGGPALLLGNEQRRPRQRTLPLHRRRRHLGRDNPQARPARGRRRPHRRRRLARPGRAAYGRSSRPRTVGSSAPTTAASPGRS